METKIEISDSNVVGIEQNYAGTYVTIFFDNAQVTITKCDFEELLNVIKEGGYLK